MTAQILQFPDRRFGNYRTLDRLLDDGLITRHQYWCAMHLRWLHLIKNRPIESGDWRAAREKEWEEAIQLLKGAEGQCVIRLSLQDWVILSNLPQVKCGLDALQAIWLPATKAGA